MLIFEEEVEGEDTKLARKSLQSEAQRKYDATAAALQAARTVGGDDQLVETLQQRLRTVARQLRASGDKGRVRLRALRQHHQAQVKKLRADSQAQETRERELKLEVKKLASEATVAREKGKEVAAAARKATEAAKLRVKEQARLDAVAQEAQERLRLRFVGKLCGELNAYLQGDTENRGRIVRAENLAVAAAGKREGEKHWSVPVFWPPSCVGLEKVTVPMSLGLRAKREVLWASPAFAWALFGKTRALTDDPKRALRKLMERLMPQYFTVLGSRYGVEGLLAEANRVLDLAFMAANWRYTKIIGVEAYRSGLHKWPPIHAWEEQSMRVERMPDAAAASSGTMVAAPPRLRAM